MDVTITDPVEALRHATGGLADLAVDVTANAPTRSPRRSPLPGARLVVAGVRGGPVTLTLERT